MAGTKDYAVLDLQDDSENLGVDLQFQGIRTSPFDFGDARTQSSGNHHEQTITFTDFPDTPEEELEQEKVGFKNKRCTTVFDTDEPSTLPMCHDKIQVTPVLPEGVFGVAEFTQVAVLEVKDRKSTSAAIKELSLKMPVPSLSHLKRVRKLRRKEDSESVDSSEEEVLLVYLTFLKEFDIADVTDTGIENLLPLGESESTNVMFYLKEKEIDTTLFNSQTYVSKVAKHSPKVRNMYNKVSPYWPCTLHEDLYLVRLSAGDLFIEEELKAIVRFMNKTLEIGNTIPSNSGENIGAVIVDNASGSVVGIGQDQRHKHPLQHATMVAIDNVAWNQGGGSWNIHSDVTNVITNICVPPDCREEEDIGVMTNKRRKINHSSSEADVSAEINYHKESSCHLPLVGKDARTESVSYICTGDDVYLTREPCMMCAMALLHSRIRRVFYRYPNPSVGALESKTKLHTLDGINHRYEVFSVKPT